MELDLMRMCAAVFLGMVSAGIALCNGWFAYRAIVWGDRRAVAVPIMGMICMGLMALTMPDREPSERLILFAVGSLLTEGTWLLGHLALNVRERQRERLRNKPRDGVR